MKFRYRTYTHAADEIDLVGFSKRIAYSQRGRPTTVTWNLTIEGVVLPSGGTQAATSTAIAQIESAYGTNGGDAILFHDDETVSAHSMYSATFQAGTKITELSFPSGAGLAYSVGRRFRVAITGEKDINDDPIVSFAESITFTGTTGPTTVWITLADGPPVKQVVNQNTTQKITQTGSAVGRNDYVTPPPPLFPEDEHVDRRRIMKSAPKRDNSALVDYPSSWNYEFERSEATDGEPNMR